MKLASLIIGVYVLLISTWAAAALPDGSGYRWALINDELDNPILLTHAGDGSGRLFVAEQGGLIWIIRDGTLSVEPFLDISRLLPPAVFRGGYSEQGLLGLAFDPDFSANGRFYVHYTDVNGDTVLARYTVSAADPDAADPTSGLTLLTLDQPFDNHNGGEIAFGPDGYLYIALGDGGDQGDPFNHAQNKSSLFGKILRLDVSGDQLAAPPDNPFAADPAFAPEVWAYGLRNPWRLSFDRATGDLYIADVGEWQREEINFQSADSRGGENYGWNLYEGELARTSLTPPPDLVLPIATYDHSAACSVTGGYVYRGAALPELEGIYFYGDYCVGRIWALEREVAGNWRSGVFMETSRQITSFGEDEAGELYLVDYKGQVLRLERAQ